MSGDRDLVRVVRGAGLLLTTGLGLLLLSRSRPPAPVARAEVPGANVATRE